MGSDSYEVDEGFAALGRTFAEYCRLFDLSHTDLAAGPVLDCGAGPSSFTAVASTLTDVIAVDPAYGTPVAALQRECEAAIDDAAAQLRAKREGYVWDYYGDVETRIRCLEAASRRFLADYTHNPGRYVTGALPDLPLEAEAVDLALVANLLFLYDDRLTETVHVEAIQDLARVATEVRVFPLHGLDRRRSDLLEPVIDTLRNDGLQVALQSVPYEFQRGATEMLQVQ